MIQRALTPISLWSKSHDWYRNEAWSNQDNSNKSIGFNPEWSYKIRIKIASNPQYVNLAII